MNKQEKPAEIFRRFFVSEDREIASSGSGAGLALVSAGRDIAMLSNLILYRSLTQTQKASAALEREGIPNRVIRTPRAISGDGCSHCEWL